MLKVKPQTGIMFMFFFFHLKEGLYLVPLPK